MNMTTRFSRNLSERLKRLEAHDSPTPAPFTINVVYVEPSGEVTETFPIEIPYCPPNPQGRGIGRWPKPKSRQT